MLVASEIGWHVEPVRAAPVDGDSYPADLRPGRRLFAAVLVVCLALGSAAGLLAWTSYRDARDSAVAGVALRNQTIASDVYGSRLSLIRLLQAVASGLTVTPADPGAIERRLDLVTIDEVGFTGGLAWIDPAGVARVATRGRPGVTPGGTWWRDVLDSGRWTTSAALTSPAFTGEVMVFAVPTRDSAGRVTGVLAAGWGMPWLRAVADRQTRQIGLQFYGPNTRLLVVDRAGQLVIGPGVEAPRDVTASATYRRMAAAGDGFTSGSLVGVTGVDGAPGQVVGYTRIGSFGEFVVLERPVDDAFAEARRGLWTWWAAIVGLAALALLTAQLAGRRIDRLTRERDELHRAEHDVVADLQRWLLTGRLPPGAVGRYLPAPSVLNAGGDWYDAIPLASGHPALLVGDVVGHGVRAALAMGQLRTAARALASRVDGPAALLSELDVYVAGMTDVAFCTAACVIVEPATGTLRYALAGHPPPLLRHPDGTVVRLATTARPLGVGTGGRAEHTVTAPPGSMVVLYTDGLVERPDRIIDAGIDRLTAAVTTGDPTADTWPETVIAQTLDGTAPTDDIALLCYSLPGPPPAAPPRAPGAPVPAESPAPEPSTADAVP